jgi:uncharacterized protein YbaA (DUF1428 family)
MSKYVDGFVIPVPKDKIEAYKAMSEKASKVWKEYGALEYRECVLEDSSAEGILPFPQLANAGPDETVVFAYITYNSRAQRDEVNAKVMADPRLSEMCNPEAMPFDCKRMACGGFETIVEA